MSRKSVSTWGRAAVVAAVLASLACATTTFQSTWRSPDARPIRLAGKKVVAIFMTRSPSIRRRAEDAMTREISARGGRGVPSYTVLSDDEVKDQDSSKAKLESLGFSGAVVMRVVGSETQYTYEPATVWVRPYYRSFWGGYWRWGWGAVAEPGYLSVDKIVKVETLVYSLEQDQLVWAGVSRTIDPAQIESFISELAEAVTKQMERDGVFGRS